jgi:glycosyltransferase involved in cell wall biosynthesis
VVSINTSWNVFNFRLELCEELKKRGYQIIIVAPTDDYTQKLKDMGFLHYDISLNNKGTNPFEDIKLTYMYFQLYKKIKPDLALHYTIKPDIYASFAAAILGIPTITNITGLGSLFIHQGIAFHIAKLLYKVALHFSKKVFFQNLEDLQSFVRHHLVSAGKADLLPGSGIDFAKFPPHPKTKPLPIVFLMIARLVKDKGIFEYVDAARRLKNNYANVEFQLLGALYANNPTAITSTALQRWQEDGSIRYLGTTDDVTDFIAQSDCIVLPSYREGMSHILLEAASMAKPLITTKVPGCMELVIEGQNGYVCKVANYKDLANKMEKMLLLDDAKRKEMGLASRKMVMEKFDIHLVIDKYLKAIDEHIK